MNTFNPIDFPLSGPLLLEASAGTGKTYSLMHLILRLLVENEIPLRKILLVTFTHAATYELKSRLRTNLIDLSEKLNLKGTSLEDFPSSDKIIVTQMRTWHEKHFDLNFVKQKINEALESIDDAAIFTIHSFCNRMLQDFVFSSQGLYDFQSDDGIKESNEVIENFLRKELPKIKNKELATQLAKSRGWQKLLTKLGQLSSEKPLIDQISPAKDQGLVDPQGEATNFFIAFVKTVPKELNKLKNKNRIFTPDDLLVEAQKKILKDDATNPFVEAIRNLFDAVLIDEFQDTDPIQYSIFDTLFLEDKSNKSRPVIFVGDPKQSIYGFRNSDLNMYFNAKKKIKERDENSIQKLDKNYRSTPGIVIAVNELFSSYKNLKSVKKEVSTSFLNNELPYENIKFDSVKQPLFQEAGNKLRPLPTFELWSNVYDCKSFDSKNYPKVDVLREKLAVLVAKDIASLLSSNTTYKGKPLLASDIAILVYARKDAEALVKVLKRFNIRTQIQSKDDVLLSEEANDILNILRAMDNPTDIRTLNIARCTKIFSHTLKQIKESDDEAQKSRRVIDEANKQFKKLGIMAAFAHLFRENQTENHLLKIDNGERALTNYQHILELLNNLSPQLKSVAGFVRWIESEQTAQGRETSEDRQLRRETDNDLVRIVTIHGSKGLQYPVVYLWGACKESKGHKAHIQKTTKNGSSKWSFSINETKLSETSGDDQEKLRQFYVALTRATARLVVPYFFRLRNPEKKNSEKKNSYIFGINGSYATGVLPVSITGMGEPESSDIIDTMEDLRQRLSRSGSEENTHVKEVVDSLREIDSGEKKLDLEFIDSSYEPFKFVSFNPLENVHEEPKLQLIKPKFVVGQSHRHFSEWTRTSFTGLAKEIETVENTNALDEPAVNEPMIVPDDKPKDDGDRDLLAFSKEFMKANEFGTLFHQLMEDVYLNGHNNQVVTDFCKYHTALNRAQKALEKDNPRGLVLPIDGLWETVEHVLNVPYPSQSGPFPIKEFRLNDVFENPLVNEMDFTISIGNTEVGRTPLNAKKLGEILRDFDPIYSGLNLSDKQLKGYLNGSIDFAFKKDGLFWIVDWKTNTLSDKPSDYTKEVLDLAMDTHHYRLQYILYLIALKRYLEIRLHVDNVYDQIGGAAYYFVRGIREGRREQGLVFDRPKNALIECLDDFLTRGYSQEEFEKYLKRAQGESR